MYLSFIKSIMIQPFSWCFADKHENYESYAVVSEYYGRGLFNKLTVVTEEGAQEPPASGLPVPPGPSTLAAASGQTYGPGAEAKLRLQEGQSKQVFVANTPKQVPAKGTSLVPISEGRMRLIEQHQYSNSLEANLDKLEPVHARKPSPFASPRMNKRILLEQPTSTGVSPKVSKNPFEEENYDESKNPFADEGENDPTNPFSEGDNYDKNYNPFADDAD